ncbi:hypothetical protein AVEN_84119-1 [Araneus ventricosus]|uniref:Uncharacterized protein n=1 Tax=Araneus ventricosus TaxID=182803 RepID=A0A4Y2RWV6_ARAVE|nr:hypothetical protein AVEN_84119-1 [Araneus ventricosus]
MDRPLSHPLRDSWVMYAGISPCHPLGSSVWVMPSHVSQPLSSLPLKSLWVIPSQTSLSSHPDGVDAIRVSVLLVIPPQCPCLGDAFIS